MQTGVTIPAHLTISDGEKMSAREIIAGLRDAIFAIKSDDGERAEIIAAQAYQCIGQFRSDTPPSFDEVERALDYFDDLANGKPVDESFLPWPRWRARNRN